MWFVSALRGGFGAGGIIPCRTGGRTQTKRKASTLRRTARSRNQLHFERTLSNLCGVAFLLRFSCSGYSAAGQKALCRKTGTIARLLSHAACTGLRLVVSGSFGSYQLGRYVALLVTECSRVRNELSIQYNHVLWLFVIDPSDDLTPDRPVLAVTAEVNALADEFPSGSHFLGLFDGSGHINLGASDQWADLETFATRALDVAADHLKVEEVPVPRDQNTLKAVRG